MLLQDFTRREPGAVALGEPFQIGDDALGSQIVRIAQRPAAERRKAESEDRADVPIARTPDNGLTEGPGGFIHDREHEPLENLRGTRATVRMDKIGRASCREGGEV